MSSVALSPAAVGRPAVNSWVVAGIVVLPTFMEILDTTVANVALRYMAGGLAAAQTDADWIITSYLAANAIVLPITGWLSAHLGRRNYFLLSVAVFTVASAMCGFATTLGQMILFRILQGLAGGGLQPCSQGILMDSFPPEKQGTAMTLFGLAAIIAPVVGPTLGGWLCVDYNWRWIFLVNVPLGVMALVGAYAVVDDPDYLKRERAELSRQPLNFDSIGLSLLVLVMCCWEIMLSKGEEWDWLGDPFGRVQTLAVLFVLGLGLLIFREMRTKSPIINFRVLGERNFAVCCIILFCAYGVVYCASMALPSLMQGLFGYDALRSGLAMSPSGISSMAAMVIAGFLMGRQMDALADRGRPAGDGRRQLRDGTDEPPSQPLASDLAADAADHGPWTALRPRQRGRLQVHSGAASRGGDRTAQPAADRRGKRRHLDDQYHPRTAPAIPPVPPCGALKPAESPCPVVSRTGSGLFPAADGRSGRVGADGREALDSLRQQQAASLAFFDVFWLCAVLSAVLVLLVLLMKRSVAEKGEHVGAE